MSKKIDFFLARLKRLNKLYKKFLRASPTLAQSQSDLELGLREVILLLADSEIVTILDSMMPKASKLIHSDDLNLQKDFTNRYDQLLKIESRLMSAMGFKNRTIKGLYTYLEQNLKTCDTFPANTEMIKDILIKIHETNTREVNQSRKLGRKKKKKRKRKLAKSIASGVFGAGIIVANTQLPSVFTFSYCLGGGAFHQAIRDVVGEKKQ